MICHDDPGSQFVESQFDPLRQRFSHNMRDLILAKKLWPVSSRVEILIHPNECLSGVQFPSRRILRAWQAAAQMPSREEPLALGVLMRKAAAKGLHVKEVAERSSFSREEARRQDCRRCRQDCLRHDIMVNMQPGGYFG
jgi:hypothetical protein